MPIPLPVQDMNAQISIPSALSAFGRDLQLTDLGSQRLRTQCEKAIHVQEQASIPYAPGAPGDLSASAAKLAKLIPPLVELIARG